MKTGNPRPGSLRRWSIAGALLLGTGFAAYHADLLRAAFVVNPFAGTAESVRRGQALWQEHCAACHGPQGMGDGPASAALRRRPKDLTHIAAPPIFPDGIVAYRIANGGEGMPSWKAALTSEDIWDLVSFIRSQHRDG